MRMIFSLSRLPYMLLTCVCGGKGAPRGPARSLSHLCLRRVGASAMLTESLTFTGLLATSALAFPLPRHQPISAPVIPQCHKLWPVSGVVKS